MSKDSNFGLNIGDSSLRFTKIISNKNNLFLDDYGEYQIPVGVLEDGAIKDSKKIEEILTLVKKKKKIKKVHLSLPVGLNQENIKEYLDLFKGLKIEITSFEIEAQSIARAILKKDDLDSYLIADFGKKNTRIFIVSKGDVVFAEDFVLGGDILSSIIEKSVNVNFKEAEEIKKRYGLYENKNNKNAFPFLLDSISMLHAEIAKHVLRWQTKYKNDSHTSIKKIIFCGGSANLIGLPEYFKARMKIPVEIADVWVNFSNKEKKIQDLSFGESLSFTTALGLALKDFD